jgi:hypothetical protein
MKLLEDTSLQDYKSFAKSFQEGIRIKQFNCGQDLK